MTGPIGTYTARNPDYRFYYPFPDGRCAVDLWLPGPVVRAVYGWLRGGGLISSSANTDRWYHHDKSVGESDAFIEELIDAGVAFARIDYPGGPQTALSARHHPYFRLPHTWMLAQMAVQYMQTHALDGLCTGSSSVHLPVDYRGYYVGGPSAGALMAGFMAFSPIGHIPFDSGYPRNLGYYGRKADGRVKGVVLEEVPSHFELYSSDISSAALPFFGTANRWYPGEMNTVKRWDVLRRQTKNDVSLYELIRAGAYENRKVGVFTNCSQSVYEASYLRSGLTMQVVAFTGALDPNAATIVKASDATKGGAIKMVAYSNSTYFIYIEPNAATNSGFPDGASNDWTGNYTVKDGAGTTMGTVTSYVVAGNDNRKTYLTRQAAVAIAKTALASDNPQFDELTFPHPSILGALVRDALDGQPRDAADSHHLGDHYSAQISGDDPCLIFDATQTKGEAVLAWMAANGTIFA